MRIIKLICFNIAVFLTLFVLINVLADIVFIFKLVPNKVSDSEIWEGQTNAWDKYYKAYGSVDKNYISKLISGFNIRLHPTLFGTQEGLNEHHKVGIEGIRYEEGWSDKKVKGYLSGFIPNTFVFGGSTTYGAGVGNNQTITYHLNKQTKRNEIFLNFGAVWYDSKLELNKLIYLLRKGYRPRRVIFIDGLNDVATLTDKYYKNFIDVNRLHFFLKDNNEKEIRPGWPEHETLFKSFVMSLPAYHLAIRIFGGEEIYYGPKYSGPRIDPNVDKVDLYQSIINYTNVSLKDAESDFNRFYLYYLNHIDFLTQIADSFHFDLYFVYQPMGISDTANLFVKNSFRSTERYKWFARVDGLITQAVQKRTLRMIDCSDSIKNKNIRWAYVDPTHYSNEGNRAVANCIYGNIVN